jgi:hypothetical protein
MVAANGSDFSDTPEKLKFRAAMDELVRRKFKDVNDTVAIDEIKKARIELKRQAEQLNLNFMFEHSRAQERKKNQPQRMEAAVCSHS